MAARLLSVCGAFAAVFAAKQTIFDVVCSRADLKTLCGAVGNFPEIATVLKSNTSNLTLFAPKEGVYPPYLTVTADLLKYHVITSVVMSSDIKFLQFPSSALNKPLKIVKDGDGVKIEFNTTKFAKVTSADNHASNGVIHIIDEFLFPPKNASGVAVDLNLTSLVSAVVNVSLVGAVNTATTIFAPTNKALTAAKGFSDGALTDTLKFHVVLVQQPIFTTTVNGTKTVPSALGESDTLTVSKAGDNFMVNGVKLVTTNILTDAGVLHVIDAVLPVPFDGKLSVLDNLKRQGEFTALEKAVDSDEAVKGFLSTAANKTLFAPVNQAFDHVGKITDLTALLQYHVASVPVMSKDIPKGKTLLDSSCSSANCANLGGFPQKIVVEADGTGVKINGANVVIVDKNSEKDIVTHGIDAVLMLPGNVSDVLKAVGLSTLRELVVQAGLLVTLEKKAGITVLAPSNKAFKTFKDAKGNITNKTALANLLLAHVFATPVYSNMLKDNMTVTSLAGAKYIVHIDNKTKEVKFNDSVVTSTDVLMWNGVAHEIDCVLGTKCAGSTPSDNGAGLSTGVVVAIVIGVLVGVAIIGYCCFKSGKRSDDEYHRV